MPEINMAMLLWAFNVLFSMAHPIGITLLLALGGYVATRKLRLAYRLAAIAISPLLTFSLAALMGLLLPTAIPPRSDNALRIAHLNTFIPSHEYDSKAAFVHNSQADIISLQELHPSLTALAISSTNLPYHVLSTDITKPYHLPMLLLSRWPITHMQSIGPRLELYQIAHPQTPFYVLQIHPHAPHTPDLRQARNEQWQRIARTKLPEPLIVVGDFNTTPWDPALHPLLQNLTAANHLPTWPTKAPLTPIDNVLTSSGFPAPTITRIRVPHSDHLGLIADFKTLSSPE